MASPSEFMPWKLTQQEFELRSGFYTTQCLQQLEQSPELANLRKLKKERLAQHARKIGCNVLVPGIRSNGVCLLRNSQPPSGKLVPLNLR